jgi:hypothetical protein
MRFGDIRRVLEAEPTSWRLDPDVDDDAEVPEFPVTELERPLMGESGFRQADVARAARTAPVANPFQLAAAVEHGLMTRAMATRRLKSIWGDEVELEDFVDPS